MKILLLEDEKLLGIEISRILEVDAVVVDHFCLMEEAMEAVRQADYTVCVVDWMLPDGSGIEFLKWMRREGFELPTLMLTARGSSDDLVASLDAGADDYIRKPFDPDELIARIRALSRRRPNPFRRETVIGPLTLDRATGSLVGPDNSVTFSKAEAMIMDRLTQQQGRAVSKEAIAQAIYPLEADWNENAIEQQVFRLRKKLKKVPGAPTIRAFRGIGYTLEENK